MQHEDSTRRIIAADMKVHSTLGNGFQEVIYQRALEIEFPYHNLTFEREKEMSIHYRGHEIGTRRVDFFVEKLVIFLYSSFFSLSVPVYSITPS